MNDPWDSDGLYGGGYVDRPVPAEPVEEVPQHQPGDYVGPFADDSILGEPVAWILGLGLTGFALAKIRKHPAVPGEPRDLALSMYSTLQVTLTAIIGIVLLKALDTRYPVPGFHTIIQAV